MTQPLTLFSEETLAKLINVKAKKSHDTVLYLPTGAWTNTMDNEWYTPKLYVNAARELMGGIDIDPASNDLANELVVRATCFYDIDTNGFDKPWTGCVWLNPPYGYTDGRSNQDLWIRRLISQYNKQITTEAVLLVNAVTDRKWFQQLWQYPVCFTDHRIAFYGPKGKGPQGEGTRAAFGSAIVYLGPSSKTKNFIELFSPFGTVVGKLSVA